MELDPYLILGVERGASAQEIKAAYIAGAKRLHPDVVGEGQPENGGKPGDAMRELNLAYEVLKDPELRARYDAEIGADARVSGFDDIEDLVRVWVDDAGAGGRPSVKERALNREQVRMEQEGWTVERKLDHLVCTKPAQRLRRQRARRATINIARDGSVLQVEQRVDS